MNNDQASTVIEIKDVYEWIVSQEAADAAISTSTTWSSRGPVEKEAYELRVKALLQKVADTFVETHA